MKKKLLTAVLAFLFSACQGGITGTGDAEADERDDRVVQDGTDSVEDPAEEPGECTLSSECDDGNPCNGEETCNPDTGRCAGGVHLADGSVCGTAPRMICLGGACNASVCGDGFVDVEGGESCEPPGEGNCNDDCSQACDGNEDCDDLNPCTNDVCDGGACSRSYVADGTSCGEGVVCCSGECAACCTSEHCTGGLPHCCEGQCRACCIDADCDDTIACTVDSCSEYLCSHTDMPDLTPCPGGICCGARCRVGGDCCSNAQCADGCKGTARPCRDVPGDSCNGQVGCSGTGENYCVEGSGPFCYDLDVGAGTCGDCGCIWSMVSCTGFGRVNCPRLGADLCEECWCEWHAGCDGVHEACTSYSDQAACDTQMDCYWSTCLEYLCT